MINRLYVCTGEVAKVPFYFDKVYANIYTAEELCFVIYENAYLIDRDILNRDLVNWIDTELKLHDLARNLFSLINQNALASSFVGTILEYVGFYSKDEIDKVENILKMNATMSVFEKWKAKADFLFESKRYLLAIKEYERVLENINDDEYELQSKVYNNMGVTYMELYLYDSAIECFKKAYSINNDETAYKHYLAAKRIKLSEDEYIKLIAEEEDAYRLSVPLEGELEKIKADFEDSLEARNMRELFEIKGDKQSSLYYEEITRMTENLKSDYRDSALEVEHI